MEEEYVKLNLDYYSGQDLYSDGHIEDEILAALKAGEDPDLFIARENRWPILYHLSSTRRNLLDWIDFGPNAKTLEIGAGCGALTGLLCEKSAHVTAVELSHRRASIIAERNKFANNLDIMVGNLNDIPLEDNAYDVITLIGVLEYAPQFTKGDRPFEAFLNKIKKYLKKDGMLVIAIENKFGLKYWSGAREDHTARFFDGLENYPHTEKVRTFSKDGLGELLSHCGLGEQDFYYPFPDYKMPKQIFSDAYLPQLGFFGDAPNFDMSRFRLFDETKVYNAIIDEGQFPFFSNSFLVICKKGEKVGRDGE